MISLSKSLIHLPQGRKISPNGDDNRSRRGDAKKISSGLKDAIKRAAELQTGEEMQHYQAKMTRNNSMAVAAGRSENRLAVSDSRKGFERIENWERLQR